MHTKKICMFLLVLVSVIIATFVAINVKNGMNAWQVEAQQAGGHILYVGGSGPNNYTKIQDAVDNASDGDTVYVFNGTYYENVVVNKTIDLIGENRNGTIIYGSGVGHVLIISADFVNLSYFKITNSGPNGADAGINIESDNNLISYCNIVNNSGKGIRAWYVYNNTIANCYIYHSGTQGIGLGWSNHYTTILNCNVSYSGSGGIKCANPSSHNTIINCTCYHNNRGVNIEDSSYCIVKDCKISDNNNNGIELGYCGGNGHDNIIENNTIFCNHLYGIWLESNDNNIIRNNTIKVNDNYGIYVDGNSDNNLIYHNNFINNNGGGVQGYDIGSSNQFDNGYPSGGNYWSDFDEPSEGAYDTNSDGIIDSPYTVPGAAGVQDLYPLMYSWGTINKPPIANFTYTVDYETYTVIVDATPSFDNDGSIVNYSWDWTNDGSWDDYGITNSHIYSFDGAYTIKLLVTDANGATDNITKTISIVTTQLTFSPTDDADADWTEPNTNFGSDPYLYAESRLDAGPRVSYVKFNISSIPEDSAINNAYFKVYVYGILGLHYFLLGTVDNSWNEDTLTWNNKPGLSSNIGFVYLSSEYRWYSWDVTNEIQNALSEGEISFDMLLESGLGIVFMYSKEMEFNVPTLEIEYVGEGPENNPPNTPSKPSGSSSGYTGTSYSYSTSATDIDGDNVKYYFDWGDGTGTWTNLVNSGQSTSKSHSWNNSGTYNVKIKAQDEYGAESDWSPVKIVTITTYIPPPPPPNEVPTCFLSANITSGYAPLATTFSMSASDTDGYIASWVFDIDNDGVAEYSGTGIPPSTKQHTYQNTGSYKAKLTVTDNDGATATDKVTIIVNEKPNQPPTANFVYTPNLPTDLQTIQFTDLSYDNDGNIVSWKWNFGDGTITGLTNPAHKYDDDGKYNVTLTVTDDRGAKDTKSITLIVKNVKPTANFTCESSPPVKVGTIITFTDSSFDLDGQIINLTWKVFDDVIAYGNQITYNFTEPGTYNVTLIAKDNDGATDAHMKAITIENPEKDGEGIPGFELTIIIIAIAGVIILSKKKLEEAVKNER